jgi:2-methylisocitrate lyase-like PEP mutase family enzyme
MTASHQQRFLTLYQARMVEDLGGQVGMLAGSVAAMSILGAPDKMLIHLVRV